MKDSSLTRAAGAAVPKLAVLAFLVVGAAHGVAADPTDHAEDWLGVDKEAVADIVRDPTDLPPPIGQRGPEDVKIRLVTVERVGQLDDGTTFRYWTFNGQVPGPFMRVRVGDRVEVSIENATDSLLPHSIDLHAVTGPGGGAAVTQVEPGQAAAFRFTALNPGLYVYHCATPLVAHHITSGMYGLILVEPEGGLPRVDHEFYVMQSELYTDGPFGTKGALDTDVEKLLNERPEYFLFNGAVNALTSQKPLRARVGESIRIFMGVGGPNFTSSFHVIGEIFDHVYDWGSVTGPGTPDVQTISVPPGGAAVAQLTLNVPGKYVLVDHALSRLERGLAGYLLVEGEPRPEIFTPIPTQ